MENLRYNISPCTAEEVQAFISKLDRNVYVSHGMVSADERSHYDRYSFMRDESKIAIVYDTSAHVISITAPQGFADELLALFGPIGRQVKRSLVPAQNTHRVESKRENNNYNSETAVEQMRGERNGGSAATRSRVFVTPDTIRRGGLRTAAKRGGETVMVTSNGNEVSTDEIFPPQRSFKKPQTADAADRINGGFGNSYRANKVNTPYSAGDVEREVAVNSYSDGEKAHKAYTLQVSTGRTAKTPRRATISFGDEDDDADLHGKQNRRPSGTGLFAEISSATSAPRTVKNDRSDNGGSQNGAVPVKRRRGRPPKNQGVVMDASVVETVSEKQTAPEYKNGYSVKNYPSDALDGVLKRLRSNSKYKVATEGTEFGGTVQEVKSYSVTDETGQKVILRYATNRRTLQLQGKRSELFGEIQVQVSRDSDYSSALEDYVESGVGKDTAKNKVSEVQKQLKKRLPTAFEFLSEQSRIDFSYGIHDFAQTKLQLSDYSVLLVPPYRGLERFVFDLQRAEGIKVKMIGQAFDKDDDGKYILKKGYQQRIGSVVYSEVMVALYTEYFSRRNFFAHSDNTDDNVSRSITDRALAKRIFDNLMDTVEYNAKKLKEIGFSMDPKELPE